MKTIFFATSLALFISNITADEPKDPFAGSPTKTSQPTDDTFKVHNDSDGRAYFQTGSESYYTRYLAAMKEPSLYDRAPGRPEFEFRFLWLRSFHDPIAVRIWGTAEGYMIRAIRMTQHKGYTLGAITVDSTRKLSDDESRVLDQLLDVPSLLTPLNETEVLIGADGVDGAQWIFETCADKKYQMIEFWSLKDYGPTRYAELGLDGSKIRDTERLLKFALHLLDLAKIKIPDDEIY
ncbi:MAG: hypothetical protein QE274_15745 [Verrucomicrobiaceae bacterium]|jgi:hypothetical protein|nr:hypothetical protein [Verrucomicrobiaceae bacterium]